MPGKQLRYKSTPLIRKQSILVKEYLVNYFNFNLGENQFKKKEDKIVKEVNDLLEFNNYKPIYTKRKLTDWVSNRLYRLRKKNRVIQKPINRVIQKPINRVIQKPINRVITVAEEFVVLNEEFFHYLPISYDIE